VPGALHLALQGPVAVLGAPPLGRHERQRGLVGHLAGEVHLLDAPAPRRADLLVADHADHLAGHADRGVQEADDVGGEHVVQEVAAARVRARVVGVQRAAARHGLEVRRRVVGAQRRTHGVLVRAAIVEVDAAELGAVVAQQPHAGASDVEGPRGDLGQIGGGQGEVTASHCVMLSELDDRLSEIGRARHNLVIHPLHISPLRDIAKHQQSGGRAVEMGRRGAHLHGKLPAVHAAIAGLADRRAARRSHRRRRDVGAEIDGGQLHAAQGRAREPEQLRGCVRSLQDQAVRRDQQPRLVAPLAQRPRHAVTMRQRSIAANRQQAHVLGINIAESLHCNRRSNIHVPSGAPRRRAQPPSARVPSPLPIRVSTLCRGWATPLSRDRRRAHAPPLDY
jgi:hypothetical protein